MQNKKNNQSKKFFSKNGMKNNIMHQNLRTFAHIFTTQLWTYNYSFPAI